MRDRRAVSIAKRLALVGVEPVSRVNSNGIFDPTIYVTEQIYVQVGDDYVVVVLHDCANMVHFFEASEKISDIIKSIKEALKLLKITEEVWNLKK